MEIPDFFKKMTVEDEPKLAFIAALLHDESSGIIVKRIAFFDDHLLKEVLLAYRRKAGAKAEYTENQVEKRMDLDKKLETLQGLPVAPASVALRDEAVVRLQPMRRLRNKAAHVAQLSVEQAEALYADSDFRRLLANFPHDYEKECAQIQAILQELLTHPDFTDGK